jgi:DnaJ-class molecular chaperone
MSGTKRKINLNYDPYKILEIEPSSSDKQIDRAYKKLALKWHPDKNKDNLEQAQKKFVEIYKAYEFLKDKEQKTQFDEAITAKKKRAAYEDQRRATSSAQRKHFIDKLREKEKEVNEPRQVPMSKPASERTATDDEIMLKKLRREGAEMLKRMAEEKAAAELAARRREEKQRQKEHEEAVKAALHPHAQMYDMSLDEMADLEKEILGI